MIVYVGFAQNDEYPQWAITYAVHAQRFQSASGCDCLVVPYDLATPELMERLSPRAVVLSGFARQFHQYSPAALKPIVDWVLASHDVPVLAICGSHQLLGFAYTGQVDGKTVLQDQPMRRRRAGEPITNADYHPDFHMERGFYELQILRPDPLFEACSESPVMYESHYCEIKEMPEGFVNLASTAECRIQAMRRLDRPLVSVQFHPEDYSERFPDGRTFLSAFFGHYAGLVPEPGRPH